MAATPTAKMAATAGRKRCSTFPDRRQQRHLPARCCLCSLTAGNSATSGGMLSLQPPVFQHSFPSCTMDSGQFELCYHFALVCSLFCFFLIWFSNQFIYLYLFFFFVCIVADVSQSYFLGINPLLVEEMRLCLVHLAAFALVSSHPSAYGRDDCTCGPHRLNPRPGCLQPTAGAALDHACTPSCRKLAHSIPSSGSGGDGACGVT